MQQTINLETDEDIGTPRSFFGRNSKVACFPQIQVFKSTENPKEARLEENNDITTSKDNSQMGPTPLRMAPNSGSVTPISSPNPFLNFSKSTLGIPTESSPMKSATSSSQSVSSFFRLVKTEESTSQKPGCLQRLKQRFMKKNAFQRINVEFGASAKQDPVYKFPSNCIRTTKYSILTWAPISLLQQFKKAANVYFLIISVLTTMSFSPKNPQSQTATFIAVLFFAMIKDGFEDYMRYRQDQEINHKRTQVYCYRQKTFIGKFWKDIQVGDFVKINCDEAVPADILLLKSSSENGLCFVDTASLDGETTLKEKMVLKHFKQLSEQEILDLQGMLECEGPSEYLEKWQARLICQSVSSHRIHASIKQLLLRGTILRNTNYIYGIVTYTGHDTKLLKNAKKPVPKMSFIMNQMNFILRTVFFMQAMICIALSIAGILWEHKNLALHSYLGSSTPEIHAGTFFIRLLTYLVAYSHLIPISLYVSLEVLKILLAYFIAKDKDIYSTEFKKPTAPKTSELIGELGQVDFIFSDKTGTLTCNAMEFMQCSINGRIYGNPAPTKLREDKSSYHINGDTTPYEIIKSQNENDEKDREAIMKFFTLVAVCHTVVQDSNAQEGGTRKYQASSPDELALVEGAREMGFDFVERTAHTLKLKIFDQECAEWEILHEFPFDSFRKRMSVIVKLHDSDTYILMTKGADSVMLPRINVDEETKKGLLSDLNQFSCIGLRTLLLGQKIISAEDYQHIKDAFAVLHEEENSVERERLLHAIYDKIELGLEYVGCTAIEDKLQEGVPETIAILLEAEIRIWVLTGDKQETAIEIGKTCGLLKKGMDICMLSSNSEGEFNAKLEAAITRYGLKTETLTADTLKKRPPLNLGVVIDGSTLAYVLDGNREMKNRFFKLGLAANSCICCRVSPKQKADVVALAKNSGPWLTMAVGDGGNDVSMILEAHVGVGVYGKEGTQATRSADFAIGQFRFLKKLLLFHGRLGYYRITSFINYFFYKNIAVVSTEIYFAFFNGLSGQIFFLEWLPMLYNAFWTALPCMFNYGLDKDVDKEYTYLYPKLYKAGPARTYFNVKTFWKWIIYSIWHGAVCFWVPLMASPVQPNGKVGNHWWTSTLSFCLIMHVVTFKLFLHTKWWNKVNLGIGVFSIVFYYSSILALSSPGVSKAFQPQMDGLVIHIFSNFKSWIILILAPAFAVIPDFLLMNIVKMYYPNPSDKVQRLQQLGITPSPQREKIN